MKTTVTACALAVAATLSAHAASPRFQVLDLGTALSSAGITTDSRVIGWYLNASNTVESGLYSTSGVIRLGDASVVQSRAYNANGAGVVAGRVRFTQNGNWSPATFTNGQQSLLPLPSGYKTATLAAARSLNDAGQVVGYVSDTAGSSHGVLWTNGVPKVIAPLAGDDSAALVANNANGQFVGASDRHDADGNLILETPFIGTSPKSRHAVPALNATYTSTYLGAINATGRAVGSAYYMDASGTYHGLPVTVQGTKMKRLATPSACDDCGASGINTQGHVTGSGSGLAFFHDGTTSWDLAAVSDLSAAWTQVTPSSINDSDAIAATATSVADGQTHVVLFVRLH